MMMVQQKRITLCFTLVITIFFGSYSSQPNLSPKRLEHSFIDQDLRPAPLILNLLETLNIKHAGTLESIRAATQHNWLRPKGMEREECPEILPEMHDELMPYFKALHLTDEIEPSQKCYDHVIVLSSNMIATSRKRLAYVNALSKKGFVFKKLHLLGAQNVCTRSVECAQTLFDPFNSDLPLKDDWCMPQEFSFTETAVFEFLYHQSPLSPPLLAIPMILYDIGNQKNANGRIVRGNTRMQIIEWIAQNGIEGSTLWISSNPYITYQDCVIRSCAPSMNIETVGPAMHNETNPNQDCLDTITRIIYEISTRKK